MRILHTSDWHIGRTFHGSSTLEHLRMVLGALVAQVREHGVDVVIVAGDIFDTSTPAADHFALLEDVLADIHEAGATVVITSGNHDSPARLGFQSRWAQKSGIHVLTNSRAFDQPVILRTRVDATGAGGAAENTSVEGCETVAFYGIPYLEPALIRHLYPGQELRTQQQALRLAMSEVRVDIARREKESGRQQRSVVISHCFAVGISGSAEEASGVDFSHAVERDITAGGLDFVSLETFDGPDYVALGHIHGRAVLSERVRYSGAPLHYSFSEAGKDRGAWLIDLSENGLGNVEWLGLPVPRELVRLTGELESLLTDPAYDQLTDSWIAAILTDTVRPLDSMRRLQKRFPYCATVEYKPLIAAEHGHSSYAKRVESKSDPEIIAGFLEYVRNGDGPSEFEREQVLAVIEEQRIMEPGRVSGGMPGGPSGGAAS